MVLPCPHHGRNVLTPRPQDGQNVRRSEDNSEHGQGEPGGNHAASMRMHPDGCKPSLLLVRKSWESCGKLRQVSASLSQDCYLAVT